MQTIDFLILSFNERKELSKCLECLFEFSPDEKMEYRIFVVDNGSSDDSCEYLKKLRLNHNNLIVNFQSTNIGVIEGRNYLYNFSQKYFPSDYIMFLDSDQFVKNGWFERYYKTINNGYDIVGSEAWLLSHDLRPIRKCINKWEKYSYIGCGGMMMRTFVMEDVGLFDKIFSPMYYEDPDFCIRAYKMGYNIGWAHDTIEHKPHILLGKQSNRQAYFKHSYESFLMKYSGCKLPMFRMDNSRFS